MPNIPNTTIPGQVYTSTGFQNAGVWVGGSGNNVYWRELGVTLLPSGVGTTSVTAWASLPVAIDPNTGSREDAGVVTSAPTVFSAGDTVANGASALWEGLVLPFNSPDLALALTVANPAGSEYLMALHFGTTPSGATVSVSGTDWGSGTTVTRIGSDLTFSNGSVTTAAGGVYVVSFLWDLQW